MTTESVTVRVPVHPDDEALAEAVAVLFDTPTEITRRADELVIRTTRRPA